MQKTYNLELFKLKNTKKPEREKKVLKIYANMTISIYLIITLSFAGSF